MSVFRYVYEIFMYYLRLFSYVNTSHHEIEKKTTTVNETVNTNSIPLLQLIKCVKDELHPVSACVQTHTLRQAGGWSTSTTVM